MMRLLAWILCLLFAIGTGGAQMKETDNALRDKVQAHIDTIVDEGAAIVDDVADSVRSDERVQEAEQFVKDMADAAEETAGELDDVLENARSRFGEILDADEAGETPAEG